MIIFNDYSMTTYTSLHFGIYSAPESHGKQEHDVSYHNHRALSAPTIITRQVTDSPWSASLCIYRASCNSLFFTYFSKHAQTLHLPILPWCVRKAAVQRALSMGQARWVLVVAMVQTGNSSPLVKRRFGCAGWHCT